MKKHLNLCLFVILVSFSSITWAENTLYWQAIKINSHDFLDPQYGISVRVIVPGTKACYLKGPLMDEYVSGEWLQWMDAWSILIYPMSLSNLQQQGFGQWELKVVFEDDQESIYTFNISGSLDDSDFLPLPDIIEPAHHASNIIGQDSVLRWDPNDAYLDAHLLLLEVTGEDYSYFSSLVYFKDDLSITQWNPGWLNFGEAYAKVGYVLVRSQMIQQLVPVSGPVINWDTVTVFVVSGAKNDFTVKFSLDFNEDGRINLSDIAVMFSHWLEEK